MRRAFRRMKKSAMSFIKQRFLNKAKSVKKPRGNQESNLESWLELGTKHAGLQSFCYQKVLFCIFQYGFNDEEGAEKVTPKIMKIAMSDCNFEYHGNIGRDYFKTNLFENCILIII